MVEMQTEPAPGESFLFEAVIVPHRSLGARGLRWVAGVILALSGAVSVGFWYLGAWPVVGFAGAEVLLALWLLRRHAAGAHETEVLVLSEAGLHVVRIDRGGRRSEQLVDSGWLRAELEERPGRGPALLLKSRGRRIEVGAALGEAEKRNLAAALDGALRRRQSPEFDNPQLRDDPGPVGPGS